MEREKIKFMCVANIDYSSFTKGKIYEGYETGASYLKDDNGVKSIKVGNTTTDTKNQKNWR